MLLPSEKGLHTSTTLVDKARTLFAREPVDYQVAEKKGDESMKVQRKDLVEQNANPLAAAKEIVPSVEVTTTYENTLLKHLRYAETNAASATAAAPLTGNELHGRLLSEYRKLYPKVNLSDDAEAAASIKAFLRDEKCRGERILLAMRLGQWEQATLQMYSGVHIQPISKANSDFPTRDVFRVGANNGLVDVQHMMDVSIPASVARGVTHLAAGAFFWTGVGRKFLQNVPNMHAIEQFSRDITEAQRQPHNWYKVAYDKLQPGHLTEGQEKFLKFSLGNKYSTTPDRGDQREITDRILTLADARVELEEKTGRSLCDIHVDLLKDPTPATPDRPGQTSVVIGGRTLYAGRPFVPGVPGSTHREYADARALHFKGDVQATGVDVLQQTAGELGVKDGSLDKLKEQVDEKIKKEKEKKEADTLYAQAKANADARIAMASADKKLTAAERAALEDPIKKSIAELDKIIAGVQVEKRLKDEMDNQETAIKSIRAEIAQHNKDHDVKLEEYIDPDEGNSESIAHFKKTRIETEEKQDGLIHDAEKEKYKILDKFSKDKSAKDKEIADAESKYEQAKNKYDSDRKYFERLIADKEKARMVKQIAPALITAIGTEITEIIKKIDALKQPDIDPVTKVKKDLTDLITEKDIKVREEDEKIATAKKTKETELAKIDAEIKRRNDAIAEPTAVAFLSRLNETKNKFSNAKTQRTLNRNGNGWDDDLAKPLTTLAAGGAPGVPVMSVEDATDEKAKRQEELKLVGKPDRYDEHAKTACEIVLKVITDKEAIETRLANAAGAEPAPVDLRFTSGFPLEMSPIYIKVLQVLAGEDICMITRKDDLKKWTDALSPQEVFYVLGWANPFADRPTQIADAKALNRDDINKVRDSLLSNARLGSIWTNNPNVRTNAADIEKRIPDATIIKQLAIPKSPENINLDYIMKKIYAYRDTAQLCSDLVDLMASLKPPEIVTPEQAKAYAIEIDKRRKLLLEAI